MRFCLDDGSVLVLVGEQETVVLPVKRGPLPPPSVPVSPKAAQPWLYLAVGGMAATIIALLVWVLVLQPKGQNDNRAVLQGNADTPATQKPASPQPVTPAPANTSTPLPTPEPVKAADPTGRWKGRWSTDSGTLFDIEFTLNETGVNQIDGQIKWTMRQTRRSDKKDKVGLSAIEHIRGAYDPQTRLLTLKGYKKDDPDNVLVMADDEYRLTVSENGRRVFGKARNGGKWNGMVDMGRN